MSGDGKLCNRFQSDPVFVLCSEQITHQTQQTRQEYTTLHCRNRLHRGKLEKDFSWLLDTTREGFKDEFPDWDDDMTVEDFGEWSHRSMLADMSTS